VSLLDTCAELAIEPPVDLMQFRLQTGETPVCGVTLKPFIAVKRENNVTLTADEVPEEGQGDSRFSLRVRWYRSVVNRGGAVCYVHPDREAVLQVSFHNLWNRGTPPFVRGISPFVARCPPLQKGGGRKAGSLRITIVTSGNGRRAYSGGTDGVPGQWA
jgi:hypothetical protein